MGICPVSYMEKNFTTIVWLEDLSHTIFEVIYTSACCSMVKQSRSVRFCYVFHQVSEDKMLRTVCAAMLILCNETGQIRT